MKIRTQITIDPELQRRARHRAAQYGISFGEYVRRLIARDLDETSAQVDPKLVFNLGDSGGSDIASDKERLVAHAVDAESGRSIGQR